MRPRSEAARTTAKVVQAPLLVSVNVGLPRDVAWGGRTVHTGIWKHPVEGPRMARRLNIDGDGQGDLDGHGGEQRAVLVYQVESYEYWGRHLGRNDFGYGAFGENLTVRGLPDDEVCIGDRYRIGEAEFEVTQPRVTCYRVGLRMGEPELPALLVSHHRPGFYMRVIREGVIQAGEPVIKTRAGPGALSVADTDALLYLPGHDPAKVRVALEIPALSPGWQDSFRQLLASADRTRPARAGRTGPAWPGFQTMQVTDVVRETSAVTSIHLAPPDGGTPPVALAGQYLTVRIAWAGDPAPVRSYSLSSAPGADTYRITVKREPGGLASGYLTRRLRAGAVVEVAAPRGEFVLASGTGAVLLVSAGIGVTPVLSMLHELAARRSSRAIWWVHTARGPNEHVLAAEAHELLAFLSNAREVLFYTAATPEECSRAGAIAGRPTKDALAELGVPAGAYAYVCGPTQFMADMHGALTTTGVDAAHVHTELFGALPPINPGLPGQVLRRPHQPPGPPGNGPLVTFARTGIATPFRATTHSVLELAEACGVNARWACRTGVCHTCVTPLLSGEVAYEPDPLEPAGSGEVLICCSHPATDIVLDM
jgi:ferredoxin-NADP reductase/MOSC domain-containing protein YiiM